MSEESLPIHPDLVYGEEMASEKAGEEVWLEAIVKARKDGNLILAQQIFEQQFRKDEDGNIFIEINGERKILGHISHGYEILTNLPDWPKSKG